MKNIVIKKCPLCKKGKIIEVEPTGFFKVLKSIKNECDNCDTEFFGDGEREGEKTFYFKDFESGKKYAGESLKLSEWERGKSDLDLVKETEKLPKVKISELNTILMPNEESHMYSLADYKEERAIRHSYGGAVRVMKGVYVGARKGESHGEIRTIDNGDLLLTNKRLIFNGDLRHNEYKINKIISIEEHDDAIEVGLSNRKKVQIFVVDEPHKWAIFIRIAVQNFKK